MSAHVFHEIHLHLNRHAKDDRPMLTGQGDQRRQHRTGQVYDRAERHLGLPG